MKLTSKIFVDKFVGKPLVFLLNILMQFIPKRKHQVKRIVVCKFMGMGSIIQSTPMIKTLRIYYPEAEIIFLTTDKNHELLNLFPFIDKVLTVNEKTTLKLILSSLNVFKYLLINRIDIFIDLEIYSFYSKIFAASSLSGNSIGFHRTFFLYKGIYSASVYFDINIPVKNLYLEAAARVGCKIPNKELYDFTDTIQHGKLSLTILKRDKLTSANVNIPEKLQLINDYIVINPNASDLRTERRWPYINYIHLINRILDLYPQIYIILTGSVSEKSDVSKIYQGINEKFRANVIDTSGKLNLIDLVKIINNSRFMITNDTGPMHIAFALKKKTIALFGPCSPVGYINQPNTEFVYRKIHCSPCVHDYFVSPCNDDNLCMQIITVNEILNMVKKFMTFGVFYEPLLNPSMLLKRAT
jgi:ADP-heptose:LPS heptosyltransferase